MADVSTCDPAFTYAPERLDTHTTNVAVDELRYVVLNRGRCREVKVLPADPQEVPEVCKFRVYQPLRFLGRKPPFLAFIFA